MNIADRFASALRDVERRDAARHARACRLRRGFAFCAAVDSLARGDFAQALIWIRRARR